MTTELTLSRHDLAVILTALDISIDIALSTDNAHKDYETLQQFLTAAIRLKRQLGKRKIETDTIR